MNKNKESSLGLVYKNDTGEFCLVIPEKQILLKTSNSDSYSDLKSNEIYLVEVVGYDHNELLNLSNYEQKIFGKTEFNFPNGESAGYVIERTHVSELISFIKKQKELIESGEI